MTGNATEGKPLGNFQIIRRLLNLGNSHAITIPTAWVKIHVDPKLPYITTTPLPDGSILIRPFDPMHPTGKAPTQT